DGSATAKLALNASKPEDLHSTHVAGVSIPTATAPPAASVPAAPKLVQFHAQPPAKGAVSLDRVHGGVVHAARGRSERSRRRGRRRLAGARGIARRAVRRCACGGPRRSRPTRRRSHQTV